MKELQKLVGFDALGEFCISMTFTARRCLHLALWIGWKMQVLPFVSDCSCVVVGSPSFHAFLVDSQNNNANKIKAKSCSYSHATHLTSNVEL